MPVLSLLPCLLELMAEGTLLVEHRTCSILEDGDDNRVGAVR